MIDPEAQKCTEIRDQETENKERTLSMQGKDSYKTTRRSKLSFNSFTSTWAYVKQWINVSLE